MGKIYQTGHAVNLGNYSSIVQFVKNEVVWAPPSTKIELPNLLLKETEAIGVAKDFKKEAAKWMVKVNARRIGMDKVNPLVTRIRNVVKACDVSAEYLADVVSLAKDIQGVRATPKIKMAADDPSVPSDESIVQISAAQTGIDDKIDNLEMLLALLAQETNYTPSEADLTLSGLTTFLDELKSNNAAVKAQIPILDTSRLKRNKSFYEVDGINELAGKVKAYFKVKYGGNSDEYHNVAKYKMTYPKG